MSEKQFNALTQEAINEAKLCDYDFELNNKQMQLFKAGDEFCHTIGGKHEYTNDMYFYRLGLENPTPEDCRPFSDLDLAPRWSIEVKPNCSFKTKWGSESMRSSITATIFRNGVPFGVRCGFDHNQAFISASHLLDKLKSHCANLFSRNWKDDQIGRKIYYDNQPAIIDRVWLDNFGCNLYIKPDLEKIKEFKPQGHWADDEEESVHWEYGAGTSAELTCDKIWWWRD